MKRVLAIIIDCQKTTCSLKNGETCRWMLYGFNGGHGRERTEGIDRHLRYCGLFKVDLKCRKGGGSLESPAVLRCHECRMADVGAP